MLCPPPPLLQPHSSCLSPAVEMSTFPLPPNQCSCFHLLTITNLDSIHPASLHSLSRLSLLSYRFSSTYFLITSLVLSRFDPSLLFVSAPVRSPTLCSWLRELPPVSYSLSACGWVARCLLLINSDSIWRFWVLKQLTPELLLGWSDTSSEFICLRWVYPTRPEIWFICAAVEFVFIPWLKQLVFTCFWDVLAQEKTTIWALHMKRWAQYWGQLVAHVPPCRRHP